MRRALPLLLCVTALLTAADRRAPGFALMDTQHNWRDLADYRGKPVVLAFIQSTCPHCAAFGEVLQAAHEKFGDKVGMLAVVDPPDPIDKVQAFITGHKITFPILFDSGQMAYSYVLTQNLQYPRVFLIDGSGMIKADHQYSPLTVEIFEGKGLEQAVTKLLTDFRKVTYYGR